MPAFFAAANKGAGIDFAAALGAATEDDTDGVDSTCDVCCRDAAAGFAVLLDGSCFEEDIVRAEESVPSSSFASRKASASFLFFLEVFVDEDEADE
jgi:hypothetical protein